MFFKGNKFLYFNSIIGPLPLSKTKQKHFAVDTHKGRRRCCRHACLSRTRREEARSHFFKNNTETEENEAESEEDRSKEKKLLFYTQLANIETNKSEQRREKKLKIAK